ncbi:hypothetical protein Lser_V15G28987 [Lactuca serriola]
MSLPNITKNLLDCLLISGVREGLVYVTLVEERLNASNDHVLIQKAAKISWLQVEVYNKWYGNKLQNPDSQLHTAGQILQWMRDTAKNMVTEMEVAIPAALGVSATKEYHVNSLFVPRKAKEAIGGITSLTHSDAKF